MKVKLYDVEPILSHENNKKHLKVFMVKTLNNKKMFAKIYVI